MGIYSPVARWPGGLLSGGDNDIAAADLQKIGDLDASATRMRKAASCAFHAADCDQVFRTAFGWSAQVPEL